MTVKAILASKGSSVVTVERSATLSDAAKILADKRIGAALILDNGRVAGILSERDIVAAIAAKGAAALTQTVESAMTKNVATCAEEDTIAGIMSRMTSGKFRHMPVIQNERLIGIISIGDVVKRRVGEMENETQAMRDYIHTA